MNHVARSCGWTMRTPNTRPCLLLGRDQLTLPGFSRHFSTWDWSMRSCHSCSGRNSWIRQILHGVRLKIPSCHPADQEKRVWKRPESLRNKINKTHSTDLQKLHAKVCTFFALFGRNCFRNFSLCWSFLSACQAFTYLCMSASIW